MHSKINSFMTTGTYMSQWSWNG